MQSDQLSYVPILLQFLLAAGFVVGTIIVSGKLGPKRKSEIKNKNFECGVEGIGNARIPFSVKYFLLLFCLYYLMSKLSSYILGQSILRN
jgi:NADH-quinone oxidoreductase subunit A